MLQIKQTKDRLTKGKESDIQNQHYSEYQDAQLVAAATPYILERRPDPGMVRLKPRNGRMAVDAAVSGGTGGRKLLQALSRSAGVLGFPARPVGRREQP